ncbi:unnamed protein product [Dicrocoelium dendriticum]|nr:unnamed protein product [Dicrocoelium dendriticum]
MDNNTEDQPITMGFDPDDYETSAEKSLAKQPPFATTRYCKPNYAMDLGSWYTDEAQLFYISDCTKKKVIASSYFLRNMKEAKLSLEHCVLGVRRCKPILNSVGFYTAITSLNLSDACLTDESIPDLCNMFKENSVITELILSDNHITSKHAEALCDVLTSSAQLERVDLHGNRFDDKASVYFSELMATSLRMSYLNLSRNDFGEAATVQFGRALPQATSLVELDVAWNRLGTGGMRQFGKGLAENKYLKILNLSFNGIGPSRGCRELAIALKGNKTLECLNLSGNRISPEGAVLLSRGFSNSTLLILDLTRNPLQTAGCFAILTGILKNTNSALRELNLQGIIVNKDFRDLQDAARMKLPNLVVRAGGSVPLCKEAGFANKYPSTKQLLQKMGRITGHTLADMLRPFDPTGDKLVTRQKFIEVLYVSSTIIYAALAHSRVNCG